VVVFGVANPDNIERRQPQPGECGRETASLTDPRRENHDRSFVEDDLQLQTEIADNLENDLFIRLPGRDDAVADRQRADVTTP
jgi:hypothetical protein